MNRRRAQDRRALRAAQGVIRGRATRHTVATRTYTVYALALVAAIVAAPIIRAAVVFLAAPELTAMVEHTATTHALTVALLAGALLLVLSGWILGPVAPSAPFIWLVAGSTLRRSVTLHPSFNRSRLVVVVVSLLIAGIWIGVQSLRTTVNPLGATVFLLAVFLGASQVSVLWLLGQLRISLRWKALVVLSVLLMITIVGELVPSLSWLVSWLGPWGWVARLAAVVTQPVHATTVIAFAALVVGAAVAAAGLPQLLDRLASDDLLAQACRLGMLKTLAVAGETRSAIALFTMPPRGGRHWRMRLPAGLVSALVVRDLIGVLRFPVRSAAWACVLVASGVLLPGASGAIGGPVSALLSVSVSVLMYFGVSGWARGLRFHAAMIGASTPFAGSPGRGILAHLVVPAIGAWGFVLLGSVLRTLGDPAVNPVVTGSWATGVVVFLMVMQVFSATKGALPVVLLTPVPSPVGDLSLVGLSLWVADAVVVVMLVVGGLSASLSSGLAPLPAFGWLAAASVLLAGWALLRFRAL